MFRKAVTVEALGLKRSLSALRVRTLLWLHARQLLPVRILDQLCFVLFEGKGRRVKMKISQSFDKVACIKVLSDLPLLVTI